MSAQRAQYPRYGHVLLFVLFLFSVSSQHSTGSSTSLNTNLILAEVKFPVADLAMAEKFYTCWRLHVTYMPGRYLLIAFSCPLR